MTRRAEAPRRSVKHDWLDAVLARPGDDLDGYAVAVAAALWSHMNPEGVCWPSLRLIAEEANVAQNTVQSRIRALEESGLLRVRRRPRGANTYHASASHHDADSRTASPDDTEGRSRRGGSPSASPADLSASRDGLSASSERLSASRDGLSASPGDSEHVNPRRGEHVNTPAQSGGDPDGSPALGGDTPASPVLIEEATSAMRTAFDHLCTLDEQVEMLETESGRRVKVPSDAVLAHAFEHRLIGLGFLDDVDAEPRPNVSALATREATAASRNVIAWCVDDDAPPPGWLHRTIERRTRFIEQQARSVKTAKGWGT